MIFFFFNLDPCSNIITVMSYGLILYNPKLLCWVQNDNITHYPTCILSFQKEKQVIFAWPYVSLRYHSSTSCDGRLISYQIPLDLPPGGARILAEDLFGMLSSIWAPANAPDHTEVTQWRSWILLTTLKSSSTIFFLWSSRGFSKRLIISPEQLQSDCNILRKIKPIPLMPSKMLLKPFLVTADLLLLFKHNLNGIGLDNAVSHPSKTVLSFKAKCILRHQDAVQMM